MNEGQLARTYKSKAFARFTRKEGIDDRELCRLVRDIGLGRIESVLKNPL